MKVEKQEVTSSRYVITVEASTEETDQAIEQGVPAFLDRVSSMQLEPGENLHEALVRRFGADRADRALSDAVINYLLPTALNMLQLEPACSPVPLEEPTPQAGEPFSFRANVYVLPLVELSDYDTPVSVTVHREYTTEEEINDQLLVLAAQFSTVEASELTGNEVRNMPTIDDGWVASVYPVAEINTVHDLREQVRTYLDRSKEEDFENQKINACVAALSERLTGEAPEEIVEIIGKDMIANIEEEILANEGKLLDVALKEQRIKREDFNRAMFDRARASVKEGMTMDAVFRHENLELTDADIEMTIDRLASSAGDEAEQLKVAASLREEGVTPQLAEVARRLKAGRWIADHAQVEVEV